MSLFGPINVFAQLNLPESVRLAIVKLAVDSGRTAAALEAILAKINEPDAEVPPELHEAIEETAAAAEEVKQAQAQQGA
jgi:hypothetical protein